MKPTLSAILLLSYAGAAYAQPAGMVDVTEAFRSTPQEIAGQMESVAVCSLKRNYLQSLAFVERANVGIRHSEIESIWQAASKGCIENGKAIDFQAFGDALAKHRTEAVINCFKTSSPSEYEAMKARLWSASVFDAKSYQFGMKSEWTPASLLACDPALNKIGPQYQGNRWSVLAHFWSLPGSPMKAVDTIKEAR